MFPVLETNLFQTRLLPWYPGQLGIAGSDNTLGIRVRSGGIVLYVDSANALANDSNDGTDPMHPKLTIGSAVASPFLTNYSVIVVSPGNYVESVSTPLSTAGPSYVTIYGAGGRRDMPYWTSGGAALVCLDMRAIGWRVENIKFGGAATAACIQIRHTDTVAAATAPRTQILNCTFAGLTTGRYGIVTHGAPEVTVQGCFFFQWNNAVGGGAVPMLVDTTPLAIPTLNVISGNVFFDSQNGCVWPGSGNLFVDNVFQPLGVAYAMTLVLQTSIVANPGVRNVVRGNTFPGDYSEAGGYRAGVGDVWIGNWATDIAEPECGDNGLTILPPAA